MRINRETLMRIVSETIEERSRNDRNLVSVYLCGTLLDEDYLLGGAADVDLVFIHIDEAVEEREIVVGCSATGVQVGDRELVVSG